MRCRRGCRGLKVNHDDEYDDDDDGDDGDGDDDDDDDEGDGDVMTIAMAGVVHTLALP